MTEALRSAPTCLLLPSGLAREIEQHAQALCPHECCGVLIGTAGAAITIDSVHQVENRRATRRRDRYEVNPRDIVALDRCAETRGREIVGFYHSHPSHPATPSDTDRAYAWPGYVYVIVGVGAAGAPQIRAWIYDDDLEVFAELPIVCEETSSPIAQTALDSEMR
jgi:proteasome lid subunit RPN8/RPN11